MFSVIVTASTVDFRGKYKFPWSVKIWHFNFSQNSPLIVEIFLVLPNESKNVSMFCGNKWSCSLKFLKAFIYKAMSDRDILLQILVCSSGRYSTQFHFSGCFAKKERAIQVAQFQVLDMPIFTTFGNSITNFHICYTTLVSVRFGVFWAGENYSFQLQQSCFFFYRYSFDSMMIGHLAGLLWKSIGV